MTETYSRVRPVNRSTLVTSTMLIQSGLQPEFISDIFRHKNMKNNDSHDWLSQEDVMFCNLTARKTQMDPVDVK